MDKTEVRVNNNLPKFLRVFASVLCIAVVVYQMSICNYFFASKLKFAWLGWIAADLLVITIFIITFYTSFRSLKKNKTIKYKFVPGELPFGYISWFLYSLLVSVKFGLLYGPELGIIYGMETSETIGPGFLQTALGLTAIVFLLLTSVHHDALPGSSRSDYINQISTTVTFDILDTVNFLSVLFLATSRIMLSYSLKIAILFFSCLNFILPTILLITLSKTSNGKLRYLHKFEFIYKFVYLFLVNLPMLVIRSRIIHQEQALNSIFIMKNLISAVIGVKTFIDHFVIKKTVENDQEIGLETLRG